MMCSQLMYVLCMPLYRGCSTVLLLCPLLVIMNQFDHPHIIKMIGVMALEPYAIVMEYASLGEVMPCPYLCTVLRHHTSGSESAFSHSTDQFACISYLPQKDFLSCPIVLHSPVMLSDRSSVGVRETDRRTDGQTDRQTDRQTETERDMKHEACVTVVHTGL